MRVSHILRSIDGVAKADVSYRKKAAFVFAAAPLCNAAAVKRMNKKLKKKNYGCKLVEIKPHKAVMKVQSGAVAGVPPMPPMPPIAPFIKLPNGRFAAPRLRIKYPRMAPQAARLERMGPVLPSLHRVPAPRKLRFKPAVAPLRLRLVPTKARILPSPTSRPATRR